MCLSFLTVIVSTVIVGAQTGSGITYIYDELGRLVAVVNPAGETAVYTYDAVGNLLSISRQSSSVVSIIEFTPNGGPVGSTVTIYGTGFSATANQNTVSFNGVAATVTSATPTKIVTSVPSGATTGPITITAPTGSATGSTPFAVSVSAAPTVTGFTPTIGTAGTSVSVTGTNFETAAYNNRVKFNITSSPISSATATNISTSVPAGATSGRVSVSTPAGAATSGDDFFVPPSPYTAADVLVTGRVVPGESRTVTLGTANKIALVVFDASAGQRVSLKVNSSTVAGGAVTIYNPNGTALSSGSFNTSGGFLDGPLLAATGTYTILIDPSGTNTGSLNFTLNNASDATGAITIGGPTVTLSLATPGQNARITFSGTAGQRVSLGMSGVTIGTSSCCSTYVSITKPDGSTLLPQTDVGTSGAGTNTLALSATGTYTILVDPRGSSTGNITLTLSEEAGGTISINGPSITLAFGRVGQNARVAFSGAAGQRVSVGMSGVSIGTSSCCSTYASVSNPDGSSLMAPIDVGTSGNGTNTLTLSATGEYSILIDPRGASTGNVTLTLSEELAGPIAMGGPSITLDLTRPGRNARLTFDGTAGQRVSLGMSAVTIGSSSCCSTYVSINKPDGTALLAPMDVGTSGAGTTTLTLPVTGAYAINVDPRGASAGNITLTLSEDLSGSIIIGGPSVSLSFTRPGQNALLTFDGAAGQRVSVGMSGVTVGTSSCCSTYVSVKNPDGTTLLAPIDVGTSGAGTNTLTLPSTGAYSIFVDPRGSNTGNITLTLSEELNVPITINGPSVTLALSRPGQNAQLTFTGTAGQRVSVGMSGVSVGTSSCCSTYVLVKNPDGTTLMSAIDVGTSGAGTNTLTLPASGTYSIFVDPRGAGTGNITITLSEEVFLPIVINGPPAALSLNRPGQNARLTFEGEAGRYVSIGMSDVSIGAPYCCDTASVSVLKPDGTTLLTPYGFGTSGGGASSLQLPVSGTYTIFVDPYGAKSGNVTLTLSSDIAGIIAINGPTVAATNAPGQNIRLTFDGAAGQRVSVGMSSVTIGAPYCCDTASVSVLKPDGTTLLTPYGFGTSGAGTPSLVLPTTGVYTIFVDPYGAKTGNVTVTLSEDLAPPITIGGPSVTLELSRAGQNARLTFEGAAGKRISVGMSGVTIGAPYCCDVAGVAIYKPDGTALLPLYGFGTGGAGTPSQILPVSGTYSVVVDPYGARTGNITLTLSEDMTPLISTGGPPVILTMNRPGQNARLTFDGVAGRRVSLGMSGVTIGAPYCCDIASVSILNPDGTTLLSPQGFGTGGGGTPSAVLPVAGTYSIPLDPYRANTGDITLTLSEDVTGAVIVNGAPVSVALDRHGQNARLTFDGVAGQLVTVRITGNTMGNVTVKLLKPDGTQLTSSGSSSSSFNLAAQTLPTTGTYTISIDPSGTNTGSLSVSVTNP